MNMNKQIITRQAVNQVLSDYWRQYRSRPWLSIVAFFTPAIGSILVFFVPPLIVAKLINIFIAQNSIALDAAIGYIALLGGSWLLGEALWRIGLHFLIRLETRGINNLCKVAFDRLVERDYDFYANNFVGSLSKKAMAFSRSFEIFSDTMLFNVTTNVLPILFVVVILWRYSPWIPFLLIFWITLTIVIAFPIMRRRSKLVALRHNAGSRMVGRLSDSLTNILAVKSFAKEKQESDIYGNYANDYADKYKKAADFQNLKFDTIISPIYVITNVMGLIAAVFFTQWLDLPAGVIVVLFSCFSLITRIFWEINKVYRHIESSISEASEFTQLLINPPLAQGPPDG